MYIQGLSEECTFKIKDYSPTAEATSVFLFLPGRQLREIWCASFQMRYSGFFNDNWRDYVTLRRCYACVVWPLKKGLSWRCLYKISPLSMFERSPPQRLIQRSQPCRRCPPRHHTWPSIASIRKVMTGKLGNAPEFPCPPKTWIWIPWYSGSKSGTLLTCVQNHWRP